jgi:hypothetical protein
MTQDGGTEYKPQYCRKNRVVSGELYHKPLKESVLSNSLYICKCDCDHIKFLMCVV